ncbi:hypothetical protein KO361_02540 [Candidatus Woesearchaeota archaeon]|nr:hypothetical protein [Candidatus Woesearchaeota archaeon]
MDISNKTLAVLLLAAIVVSFGSTFISISRLGAMSTTGYQTFNDTDTGSISLLIEEVISITTEDSPSINFGTCVLDEGVGVNISSETSQGDGAGACPDYNSPVPISVRNNGNLPANVEFNVSDVGTDFGGDFLRTGEAISGTDNSSLRYKLLNDGWGDYVGNGGCAGYLGNKTDNLNMTNYNIFQNTSLYNACSNLTSGSDNSFLAHFEIRIPNSASTGGSVTVTFYASEVI